MLDKLEDLDPFAKAILIPQQCDDDGCMSVYKSDRAFMAHFDATGGELHLTSLNGREVRMDFVASSFGITVPDEGELIISDPIESCGEIDVDVAAAMPGKAVIVKRGGKALRIVTTKFRARFVDGRSDDLILHSTITVRSPLTTIAPIALGTKKCSDLRIFPYPRPFQM